MFIDIFKGKKWNKFKSHKEIDLTYAKYQGKSELSKHFNNYNTPEERRPYIIDSFKVLPLIEIPLVFK